MRKPSHYNSLRALVAASTLIGGIAHSRPAAADCGTLAFSDGNNVVLSDVMAAHVAEAPTQTQITLNKLFVFDKKGKPVPLNVTADGLANMQKAGAPNIEMVGFDGDGAPLPIQPDPPGAGITSEGATTACQLPTWLRIGAPPAAKPQ